MAITQVFERLTSLTFEAKTSKNLFLAVITQVFERLISLAKKSKNLFLAISLVVTGQRSIYHKPYILEGYIKSRRCILRGRKHLMMKQYVLWSSYSELD